MTPDTDDHRRLGIAIARITLNGTPIHLADPRLQSGWHGMETDVDGGTLRWTDGDAVLTIADGGELEVEVAMTARYWRAPAPQPIGRRRRIGTPAGLLFCPPIT